MAKKLKKINVSEKQVQLVKVDDQIIIKSVQGEEIKTENLTEVLDRAILEETFLNIRIATFKEKKESVPKLKSEYRCSCNSFESKNKHLNLICGDCSEPFVLEEVTE